MTQAEKRRARQSPEVVEAAVAYAEQTTVQRAQISGLGWAMMVRKTKALRGV